VFDDQFINDKIISLLDNMSKRPILNKSIRPIEEGAYVRVINIGFIEYAGYVGL